MPTTPIIAGSSILIIMLLYCQVTESYRCRAMYYRVEDCFRAVFFFFLTLCHCCAQRCHTDISTTLPPRCRKQHLDSPGKAVSVSRAGGSAATLQKNCFRTRLCRNPPCSSSSSPLPSRFGLRDNIFPAQIPKGYFLPRSCIRTRRHCFRCDKYLPTQQPRLELKPCIAATPVCKSEGDPQGVRRRG